VQAKGLHVLLDSNDASYMRLDAATAAALELTHAHGNGGGSKDAAGSVLTWLGRGRVRTKGGWRVRTASCRACWCLLSGRSFDEMVWFSAVLAGSCCERHCCSLSKTLRPSTHVWRASVRTHTATALASCLGLLNA
jgi:hypothetical protein